MTSTCQKSICIYQDCRNKGFMFTIKKVWDQVCSPENEFFKISSCKCPSTSSLKSFTWFWRGTDELLLIYFFIPSACPAHVTNLLILIEFLTTFWSETTHIYIVITLELEEILRNYKQRSSWFLLLFKFSNKKHYICDLRYHAISEVMLT